MHQNNKTVFVVDFGHALTKIGVAGDPKPPLIIPSIVTYMIKSAKSSLKQSEYYFGNSVNAFRGKLVKCALWNEKGILDMDLFVLFCNYLFSKFKIPTEASHLILAKPLDWSNELVDQIKKIFFQEFKFKSICINEGDFFALYYHNIKSGVVVDIGSHQTRLTPYLDNILFSNAKIISEISGNKITSYLKYLLEPQFKYIDSPIFDSFAEAIKIKKCFFVDNFEENLTDQAFLDKIIEEILIPQFNIPLKIGIEKVIAPEILFQPNLSRNLGIGLGESIIQAIQVTPFGMRKQLFNNMIFIGFSVQFPQFKTRLMKELSGISLLSSTNKIIDTEPGLVVWKGMEKFAHSDLFEQQSIQQTDFLASIKR